MKNVVVNARYWVAGTLVALIGVALARVIGPRLEPSMQIVCTVAGQLLALAGLGIISVGVSRRVWRSEEPPQS